MVTYESLSFTVTFCTMILTIISVVVAIIAITKKK